MPGTLYDIQRKKRPQTKKEKKRARDEYPEECFLVPKKRKYIVCDKKQHFDCDLLRTSYMHAKTWQNRKPEDPTHTQAIAAAKRRADKEGCDWFKGAKFPGSKKKHTKTTIASVLAKRRKTAKGKTTRKTTGKAKRKATKK